MRVFCILLALSLVLAVGCSKKEPESSGEATPAPAAVAEVEESLIYYTCPMESHKHVHSDQPGSCPECQMALVRGVTTSVENREFYGCPMETHSHIRRNEPGTCSECSMTLKPMRLDRKKA